MPSPFRWTAWNLTPDGWQSSPTVDNATEAVRDRPRAAVLSLLSMYCVDEPGRGPTVSELFRSPDANAVAAAVAKHGQKPPR